MSTDDHWIEVLRCPRCKNTGTAELSELAGSFDIKVDIVPEGLGFSNPSTAPTFTVLRATAQRNSDDDRLENVRFGVHVPAMREHWTEDLVCPNCQKTGQAELSQTDDLSFDIEADLVPAGFKVIQLEHGIIFHCASCDIPVVP